MGPVWRIEMLGGLQALSEDLSVSRFRTRRVGLLLAYLAYHRERHPSRDELSDLLWPEAEPDFTRRNLRQTLASLRRHLEPPTVPTGVILVAKQGRVGLEPRHIATDVEDFRALVHRGLAEPKNYLRAATLKRAIELYRGDFLPGYYEEWVQQERLLLEDLYVSALQNLAQACEAEGQPDEAIRYIRLALVRNAFQEDLHAALMRLYLASARPASALHHFEEWRAKMTAELAEEPSPALQSLADRARREDGRMVVEPMRTPRKTPAPEPAVRTNVVRLPVQLTRFFGRISERNRTVDEFANRGARLVTLHGPAGAGKTRLSVEVGRALAEDHGWNVWFVSLADIADGAELIDAVVRTMKLPMEGAGSPLEVLQSHLTGTENLLIVDNLEHILEEAVPSISRLLQEVPSAALLATSRHSLKIEGEREMSLDPLPAPDEEVPLPVLAEVPSIQLFVDRAQAVLPDFQLTPHNAQAIAALCFRLDGLPLAIEIASGLSNAFSPAQLLQNLESRLEILRSRRRDLSDRHRSLRAAIDYSYDLLDPAMQRLFASLSVFRGGFTAQAAAQIGLEEREAEGVLRMILDLLDRSLLRTDDAAEGDRPRFRLLESFREYGAERLSPAEREELCRRHAEHFLQFGRTLAPYSGHLDRENRLVALRYFVERRDVCASIALLRSLQSYSYTGQETLQVLAASPEMATADPVDQLSLLGMLGKAHRYAADYDEAYRIGLLALERAEALGHPDQIAIYHQELALTLAFLGRREEAISHSEENLRYGLQAEDARAIEIAYSNIGTNRWGLGDFDGALEAFGRALEATRGLDGSPLWSNFYNLSRVHLDAGHLDEGLEFAGEGLRIAQSRQDEFGTSMCLSLVSLYHRLNGQLVSALAVSHEALVKRRKAGFLFWTLNAILAHATILIAMGEYRVAATLLAASRSVAKLKREVDDREFASGLATVKANLPEADFALAWAEGLAMNLEEAFRLATRYGGRSDGR